MAVSNKPPDGTLWNVVAVDLINTPKEDRGHLQDQLEAFAKLIPPGTPVALVSMADGIKVLSSFTAGQPDLLQALKKGLGPLNIGGPANIVERGEIAENVDFEHQDSLQHKADIDVERQAQRGQMTLEDFGFIARWLAAYPGKKNVFWLSSGFPIEAKPLGSASYNSLAASTKGQQLPMQDKTDQQLEAARVAIYPLDVRGVAVADIEGETTADTTGACRTCASKDSDLKTGQQSEMLEIAHATGGVARFNNDLTQSLLQGLRQSESYYTLSYTPPDEAWDGSYHRLKLTLDRPGIQVVYRQGYYARDVKAAPPPTAAQFRDALDPGAPSAASVLFRVNVVSTRDSADLQYAIDPSTVQFTQGTDGKLQADLDCAILEFDAKGKALEKSLIRLSESKGPNQQTQSPAAAITAKQSIALKAGATTLVIGIRDRATGEFGTLDVSIPAH
jgi:VWFA-related protein